MAMKENMLKGSTVNRRQEEVIGKNDLVNDQHDVFNNVDIFLKFSV